MTLCWFGDDVATCEYWFEPAHEWRPLCVSHESVGRDNLPPHYFRSLDVER
jgi:hypothetical protein